VTTKELQGNREDFPMGPFKDIGVEKTSHVATDGSQKGPCCAAGADPSACRRDADLR
jgi:hypothetical protein